MELIKLALKPAKDWTLSFVMINLEMVFQKRLSTVECQLLNKIAF